MARRWLGAVAMAALGLGVVPAQAATQTVSAIGVSFGSVYVTPAVQAAKGDTIKFVNMDLLGLAPHTLTLDDARALCKSGAVTYQCSTGQVAQGASKSFTLSPDIPAGQYPFHCDIHATMRGVLNVS